MVEQKAEEEAGRPEIPGWTFIKPTAIFLLSWLHSVPPDNLFHADVRYKEICQFQTAATSHSGEGTLRLFLFSCFHPVVSIHLRVFIRWNDMLILLYIISDWIEYIDRSYIEHCMSQSWLTIFKWIHNIIINTYITLYCWICNQNWSTLVI
jgi:hypothetical protein